MEDGDRPFNYFQHKNRTVSVSTGTLNNVPTQQMQRITHLIRLIIMFSLIYSVVL